MPNRIGGRSVLIGVAALLILGVSFGFSAELKAGQKAPHFELPTIFGDSIYSSKDLFPQSTLTVLILWTSSCPNCRKALKSCRDMAEKVREKGVRLIGINFDTEKLATGRRFIMGEKIDFVNLHDFQGKVARAYEAESYDFSTFIVDRSGRLKYVSYGHRPDVEGAILKKIRQILGPKQKEKSKDSKANRDRKV
ncbi:MAG: peroxiredoxin family protein [bacterium]